MDANKTLEQVKTSLGALEKRVARLEQICGEEEGKLTPRKRTSLKEFILRGNPKDDVQRTLAIGYFLEKYRGESSFNVKDLEGGFREAKEKVPQNINDKVNLNIRRGYMMKAGGKKDKLTAWTVTNSGERYMENNFTKE